MGRHTNKGLQRQGNGSLNKQRAKPNDKLPSWVKKFAISDEMFDLVPGEKEWKPPHLGVIHYSKQTKEAKEYVARKRKSRKGRRNRRR